MRLTTLFSLFADNNLLIPDNDTLLMPCEVFSTAGVEQLTEKEISLSLKIKLIPFILLTAGLLL